MDSVYFLTGEEQKWLSEHGTIKLESKENVGTTFTVTIPLEIDHNAEKEQQKKVEKPDLSGKSVLLVEDNELNLEIAKCCWKMKRWL